MTELEEKYEYFYVFRDSILERYDFLKESVLFYIYKIIFNELESIIPKNVKKNEGMNIFLSAVCSTLIINYYNNEKKELPKFYLYMSDVELIDFIELLYSNRMLADESYEMFKNIEYKTEINFKISDKIDDRKIKKVISEYCPVDSYLNIFNFEDYYDFKFNRVNYPEDFDYIDEDDYENLKNIKDNMNMYDYYQNIIMNTADFFKRYLFDKYKNIHNILKVYEKYSDDQNYILNSLVKLSKIYDENLNKNILNFEEIKNKYYTIKLNDIELININRHLEINFNSSVNLQKLIETFFNIESNV